MAPVLEPEVIRGASAAPPTGRRGALRVADGPGTLAAVGAGALIGGVGGALAGMSQRDVAAASIGGAVAGLVASEIAHAHDDGPGNPALSIRQGWRLTRDVFARLVGYSVRTIAGYESATSLGPVPARRYEEIRRLRAALETVMKPNYVNTWLTNPNPALDGSTPLQVIERGESDRVYALIYYIDSGMS